MFQDIVKQLQKSDFEHPRKEKEKEKRKKEKKGKKTKRKRRKMEKRKQEKHGIMKNKNEKDEKRKEEKRKTKKGFPFSLGKGQMFSECGLFPKEIGRPTCEGTASDPRGD